MSRFRVIGVVCLCFLLFTAVQSIAASHVKHRYKSAITIARSEIWRAINSGKCGSAAVAIAEKGKIVYAEGFGMEDREKGVPVDKDTIFNIGSISKVYVAAAIMILVDEGRVSLDTPVKDYLAEFKMADDRYKDITVRMLLNHTSGIPGTQGANSFGFRYEDSVKEETIKTLNRSHLKHTPGAMTVYCNDGFTLAEMIVERVTGTRFLDFLNQKVFKRLGLKNTGIGVGEINGKRIALYYDAATGKIHPPEIVSILGAGGLSSNVVELCRFVDALLLDNRLLKKASLVEMKKAQPSKFKGRLRNSELSFGLGWDITGLPSYDAFGIQVLGKSGGTGNYSTMVFTVPDKRLSVAVLASGSQSGAMKIALDILDAVLCEKGLVPKREKTVFVPPEAQKFPNGYDKFNGYYANGMNLVEIIFDADKSVVNMYALKGHDKKLEKTLVYNDGYYHDNKGNCFYFSHIEDEKYFVNFLTHERIDMIAFQKVKPIEKPKELKIEMDGKIWLRRNVSPFESIIATESHFEKSSIYRDLPSYVYFRGIKRIDSTEFAGMTFDAIRDQTELTLFEKNGTTCAWVSDLLYCPADASAALKEGENQVKIGSEGYNEWLVAQKNMVLSFTKPKNSRVIVFSSDGSATYDSVIDKGDVYVARGDYIECVSRPNDVFKVKARSVSAGEKK